MIGGRFGSASRLAVLAAAGFAASTLATGAMAADLGGDCCADLEERVAELEATTARKGNRKVSLTISGQVNEMVLFFDDGTESNVYVVSNENSGSRFRLVGKAQITPDWSAGYYLEFNALFAGSSTVDQDNDEGGGSTLNVRQSNWWLESKQLGRLTVGQGSSSTDDIVLADVEGAGPAGYSDISQIAGNFFVAGAGSTTRYSAFVPGVDTARRNVVRYDSPTFGGFKVVAAYGEDDFWDVALWWSGKIGDQITYAGGVGYLESSCSNPSGCELINGSPEYNEWKGSASFLHNPTGLFITGAFSHREYDDARADFDYWYVRTGIVAKILPLGKTVFHGEYAKADDGAAGTAGAGLNLAGGAVLSSELTHWGLGITQHIDAAAMEIYMMYRNEDAEASTATTTGDFDDLHLFLTGARIKF